MSRRRAPVVAALGLAGLGLLSGCLGIGGSKAGASPTVAVHRYSPPIAHPPALSGTLLAGGSWSLTKSRGKVVVLNFFQSNCAPCETEAPILNAAATKDAASGVVFMGVDVTDTNAAGRAYERTYDVPYGALEDPSGVLLGRFGRYEGAEGTPDTLVFTATGALSSAVIGGVTPSLLSSLIKTAQA